jgi:cytidyltransferase-like protein
MNKKVFVTGCFDLLHSGHVAFLKEAAQYGDLYVCIGNDENVKNLKGRYPVNHQNERWYMLDALACVKDVRINKGWGILDFEQELEEIAPDVFVVNEDGHTPAKEALCRKNRIEYHVLSRKPHGDLPVRSTTSLRTVCTIPFRIDIAGGWLDQPYVSKFYPGPVLTVSIEPTIDFNDRSGMASSTRRKAIELWKTEIPAGDKEQLAKILFVYDNPPGSGHVSGSQDSIGIVFPGLNKLHYNNNYWPESIETIYDEDLLGWIESHLYLVTLGPRISTYNVLENTQIDTEHAKALADAADLCWDALARKDIESFGAAFKASFEAQIAMFPNMVDAEIWNVVAQYRSRALGWKLSGAGGGGYLILVSDTPIENAIQVKIRRRDVWS